MKKSLKLALAGVVLGGSFGAAVVYGAAVPQSASEARVRLEMLRDLFKDRKLESFAFLNGHDDVGMSKNRVNIDVAKYAELTKSEDNRGAIICVEDGNYAVNQMHPTLVGKSTVSGENIWYEGVGHQMTPKLIKALSESPDGWATVRAIETTGDVENPREGKPLEARVYYLAARSDVLLGHKNDTGKKFFCAVRFVAPNGTDWADNGDFEGRMDEPNRPNHKKGKKGKKHHHHEQKKVTVVEDKETPPPAA